MQRPLLRGAIAVGALLLAACGDNGVAPGDFPRLQLSVTSVSEPTVQATYDGAQIISCDVEFHLVSLGHATVRWTGGMLRWYAGKDRSTPVDSTPLRADEVQSLVGAYALASGETADPTLRISASVPYGGVLDIAYVGGKMNTAQHVSAPFTCGPAPSTNHTPPTVSVRIVTPEETILQPGDQIVLHIDAASATGLWQTLVAISGPCEVHQLFNEQLHTSASHDVALTITGPCSLNTPLTVTAAALDAVEVETVVSQPTTRFLVDRTPPTLMVEYHPPGTAWGDWFSISGGVYFVGESIKFGVDASDNNALRAVVWELPGTGVRDSLLVADTTRSWAQYAIPVRAEWGTFGLRIFARDTRGLESPAKTSADGAFSVYPSANLPVTTITFANEPLTVRHDSRSNRLFVLAGNGVDVRSASTLALEKRIPLEYTPGSMDVVAGGDTIFVAPSYGSQLTMIDLAPATPQLATIARTDGSPFQLVTNVFVMSNGHVLVLEDRDLVDVDRATLATRVRTDAVAHGYGVRSSDRNVLYVISRGADDVWCTQRYDAASDAFAPCSSAPYDDNGGISTDASGDRIALGYSVWDASLTAKLRRLRPPNQPPEAIYFLPAQLSFDGTELYMPYNSSIVRARVSDGAIVDRIPLPFGANPMWLAEDGSAVFVKEAVFPGPWRIARVSLR